MIKQVIVKLQVEGIHRWSKCPIKEVFFLKDFHRHIFYIEARKNIYHNDRDIEIIMLKRQILEYLGNQPIMFNDKSCEDIAEDLLFKFNLNYIKVLEDNENGALIKL